MKPPLLCRTIGHRWQPSYIGEVIRHRPRWVYVDHVCTRCHITMVRLAPPAIEVADSPSETVNPSHAED